jgi:hypothetical protein
MLPNQEDFGVSCNACPRAASSSGLTPHADITCKDAYDESSKTALRTGESELEADYVLTRIS